VVKSHRDNQIRLDRSNLIEPIKFH